MKKIVGLTLVALFCASLVVAVPPGPGMGGDPSAANMEQLSKIMGEKPFSAKVEVTITPKDKRAAGTPMKMEMKMFMSQGKSRVEMDYGKMIAASLPPGAAGMSLGVMVTITRPDKKVVYQLMDSAKAYAEMPIQEVPGAKNEKAPPLDRKVEGTEKVEGYECQKVRNTTTLADGTKSTFYTWEAKELGGLPVKGLFSSPEGDMQMIFKDIKTDKPDASVFEVPAGYKKYGSMQELMMQMMMKMMMPAQ